MAKQKISTEEVKTEMTALDSILQKNAEMERAVTAGIQAMNFGMTQNMQFNMTEKSLSVMQGLKSLTESLRQGKTVLGQVVSAYESTDANLKRNVEDWVGGTEVTSSGSSAEGKSDAGAESDLTYGFYDYEFVERLKEYREILINDDSLRDKMDATIKLLNDIRKDGKQIEKYLKWLSDDEIKIPYPISTGLDFIKGLDTGNKLVSGLGDYISGLILDEKDLTTSGAKNLFSSISSFAEQLLKTDNPMKDFGQGLTLSYGKNMLSNWIESIQNETEVSEVYWNTFANSAVDVFKDTICNTTTLAIGYLPAQGISALFGFDLQGAYESVSDKKGFAAVTDSFEQLGDIFKENSSWKTWKSGMDVICNTVKGWFH